MQGCRDVWSAAERGLLLIVTSALTTAEVIYKKGTPKLDQSKRVLVSNFFRQEFISQRPLTREIAELARDVVWDCAIKPKDAVHVATAAFFKLRDLHSFDGNLVTTAKVNVGGFEVSISKPTYQAQAELITEDPNKGNAV